MKFDYKVNHNGTYYNPGEEVPVEEESEYAEEELPFADTDIEMDEEPARRGRPRKSEL